jgi:hypothetical protein
LGKSFTLAISDEGRLSVTENVEETVEVETI